MGKKKKQKQKSERPIEFFGGLSIPLFILGLIFGDNALWIGLSVLFLFGLVVGLYLSRLAPAQAMLNDLTRNKNNNGVGLIIPIFVVAGIFGNDPLMFAVLGLAALCLVIGVFYYANNPNLTANPSEIPSAQPQSLQLDKTEQKALPATASGEIMPELNIRELCHGLPPSASGQVILTLEHLEAAVKDEANHSTQRAFNAKQGIQDYLPSTIKAWKEQPETERNIDELEQALQQIRDIVGENNHEATTKAWETQQRFLASKTKNEVK